jgi:hypothetical protein
MKKGDLTIGLLTLLVGFGIAFFSSHPAIAQGTQKGLVHVSGVAVPTSYASPTLLEGGTATGNLDIIEVVFANNSNTPQNVSIEDCTVPTPAILFSNVSIPANGSANSVWTIALGNVRFTGCLKWQASSTSVIGWMVGTR